MTNKPERMPKGYYGWSLIDGYDGYITLKDVLHNLSVRENGDSKDTGHIVGVVSTLIACGMTFEDATQLVYQHLPSDCKADRIPKSWRYLFQGKIVSNASNAG